MKGRVVGLRHSSQYTDGRERVEVRVEGCEIGFSTLVLARDPWEKAFDLGDVVEVTIGALPAGVPDETPATMADDERAAEDAASGDVPLQAERVLP